MVSRKTLLITGSILAVLAALAVLIWRHFVEEERDGRVAWETYRAAAEQRGVRLFIRDMLPPDVPDEENYAAIPVIREMFGERKPGAESGAPFAFPNWVGRPPQRGSFSKGEPIDLGAWRAYLVKAKLLDTMTEDVPGDVLRALETFEPSLQQLRDASARPRCKFPTRWEAGGDTAMPGDTPMPHVSPLRAAGSLFSLRMEVLLARDDTAGALSEFRHGMRLREAMGSEPSSLLALVRLGILPGLERAIWNGLAAHRWTEGDLDVIERNLAGLRLLDEFQTAIESERGFFPEMLVYLTGKSSQEIFGVFETIGTDDVRLKEAIFPFIVPKGKLYHNALAIHEGIDVLLATCKAARINGSTMIMGNSFSAKSWLAARAAATGRAADYYSAALLGMLTFHGLEKAFFEAHTKLQQTLLSCALERFWIKHHAFPEHLDELVPQFIAEVPLDIGDGKRMRYRLNLDGGYDVWSIGPDRRDDGGVIDPSKRESEQTDWIWHMPAPAKAP